MKRQNLYDLTEGGILRKLLLVAVPIMGTQLMQMTYNLTDMFWLGQGVGSAAVAASGGAGMYVWLSMAFLLVGRMGAEIGVSQSMGRRDAAEAQRYAQNAVVLALALGVLYGAAMLFFSRPLIRLIGIREEALLQDAALYLRIIAVGVPLTFVSGAVTGIFNGAGNSKRSFFANATGLAVNMALDPLFIIGLKWGVVGAAVATVMAQAVVCAMFLFSLKYHKESPFPRFVLARKPEGETLRQIARWSAPVGLESMLFTLLAMVTTRIAASFGQDAIAIQRVGAQIESLSWLIGGGFGTAVTAFVGQNFGARKWTRIHASFRISFLTMAVWGVFITLVLFFGGRALYRVFIQGTEVQILDGGAVYLRILSVCQLFCCLEAVGSGMFRGIGKTLPPSVSSIGVNLLRVPAAYYLSKTALGLDGVWWGISLVGALRGIVILSWYLFYAKSLPREDGA